MNKYSQYFVRTLKEAPRDVDTVSHQLMVRAGLIRKVASGIYTILPMGLRVFSKVNQIIREEMSSINGVECFMPHLIPSELWKKSGRWDQYGKELLRLEDRSGRDFCFGPTHEEVVTDFVSSLTSSYKQLPIMVYQIQTKFRDEIRPRFGLMRGREFLMKDAYSFHDSQASLDEYYDHCRQAYVNIFTRCGLNFIQAVADSGAIGGDVSVEFLVIADTGEDEVLVNQDIGYAANVEAAECLDVDIQHNVTDIPEFSEVDTPDLKSIESICASFDILPAQTLKSIFLITENEQPILICLQGDKTLNETKLNRVLGCGFRFASDQEIIQILRSCPGFIGPINIAETVQVFCDFSLKLQSSYLCGANKKDTHFLNVVISRDVDNLKWVDIRNAEAGDPCPIDPMKVLDSQRGIEVGHVFKLGTKYSEAMDCQFTTKDGGSDYFKMGCYGIGVGRTIAAAIEQSSDDHGIIWPAAIAPFDVVILNLFPKESELSNLVDRVYSELSQQGLDVIVDDRIESPGIKFKDADLIGFPYQLIIGKKSLESNEVELKFRSTGERKNISIHLISTLVSMLQ